MALRRGWVSAVAMILMGCVHNAGDDAGESFPSVVEASRHPAPVSLAAQPPADAPPPHAESAAVDGATGAWVGIGFGLNLPWASTTQDSPSPGGAARIAFVFMGSPAQQAGVQTGDVVTAVDGQPVHEVAAVRGTLRALAVGQTVHLTLQRAGVERQVALTAEAEPSVNFSSPGMNVKVVSPGMIVLGDPGRTHVDDENILQRAIAQLPSACAGVVTYATQHPDDAGARQRVSACRQEIELSLKEMLLGLQQLHRQQLQQQPLPRQ